MYNGCCGTCGARLVGCDDVDPFALGILLGGQVLRARVAQDLARRPRYPEPGDLLDVGVLKALGYLSYPSLRDFGLDPAAVEASLLSRGLETHHEDGCLYAWDPRGLQVLLGRFYRMLRHVGWPERAREFALRVARESVDPRGQPALYRLIGLAFADPRFC